MNKDASSPQHLHAEHKFKKKFDIEVECWLYALGRVQGEIPKGMVHCVVRELSPVLIEAIKNEYAFSVLELAQLVASAAQYVVDKREVAFSIIAQLPAPRHFNEDQQFALAQIIDPVDQQYGKVLERLEKKWRAERLEEQKNQSSTRPLQRHAA